ncbi:MAG: hypothetical protein DRR06_20000 [Gammaproteobacteria bacterium]|nr:MAG: hypothetical protein DRR06_20000 [Gammaproteobacteria bacterium]
MSVATIINQQLRAFTPSNVFCSWGASKFQAVGANQIEGIGESYSGALMFFSRGFLHRGHVLISLNGMDEYTISIGSVRKGKMNVKKQIKGIHFDMLGTIIDSMIETKNNYEDRKDQGAA